MGPSKKILVAPLNWGLGHATRCIPVIRALIEQGAEVYLASDGRALELLRKEFPDLIALELPGYGVTYPSSSIIRNVFRSFPTMIKAVYSEYKQLQVIIDRHGIQGVISDNRLGCFSRKIPCVYLTHQINLLLPNPFLQWMGRWVNYFFIRRFDECWVPDIEGPNNLSGNLSHGTPIHTIRYIGILSRFRKNTASQQYDVVVVLSGPEPQRTMLEQQILKQAAQLPYRFKIIQGRTEIKEHFFSEKHVEVVSYMTGAELNECILSGKLFVGRTGYSTVMDLARIGGPALLIPTPGQTEQEYLGERLSEKGIFQVQAQQQLHLGSGIPNALRKKGLEVNLYKETKLARVVSDFLHRCS